jgi:hypothetical protein
MNSQTDGLLNLKDKISQMEREMKKTLSFATNKLTDIMKTAGVVKEKRGKFSKKPCNMKLMSDNTIVVVFDDPSEAPKFFP